MRGGPHSRGPAALSAANDGDDNEMEMCVIRCAAATSEGETDKQNAFAQIFVIWRRRANAARAEREESARLPKPPILPPKLRRPEDLLLP